MVLSVVFHDVNKDDHLNIERHRVDGALFDSILYADDTICASQNANSLTRMLHEIEIESGKYGLKLNQKKCELLKQNSSAAVYFRNGRQVKGVTDAAYLGCSVSDDANATKEINRRKSACCYILKRMHNFWRHSDCSMGFKLHVLNAIIRSKLM